MRESRSLGPVSDEMPDWNRVAVVLIRVALRLAEDREPEGEDDADGGLLQGLD